jgi:uncharacterized membrane protein
MNLSLRDPVLAVNGRQNWLFSVLVQFPVVCFIAAFVMDVVYWRSMSFEWETFSVWLLAAGLAIAGLAAIVALIDFLRRRPLPLSPFGLASGILVFFLSLINAFVHSRDGYTAVVPTGLTLSAIVVIIMIVAALAKRPAFARQSGAID